MWKRINRKSSDIQDDGAEARGHCRDRELCGLGREAQPCFWKLLITLDTTQSLWRGTVGENYKCGLQKDHKEPLDFEIKSAGTKKSFLKLLASECYHQTFFGESIDPTVLDKWQQGNWSVKGHHKHLVEAQLGLHLRMGSGRESWETLRNYL